MIGHLLYELPWNNNIDNIDIRASTFQIQQHFLNVAHDEHMCLNKPKKTDNNYVNEHRIARIIIGIEMLNSIENIAGENSDYAAIFAIPLSSSDDNYIKSMLFPFKFN